MNSNAAVHTGVQFSFMCCEQTFTPCTEKGDDTKLMTVTLLIRPIFKKKFTVRFSSKFAAKYLLKIPPNLICVAICETLMSKE